MSKAKEKAILSFRMSVQDKKAIEDAAMHMGQTIGDFAISTLVRTARQILHEQQVTSLSERDGQLFLAILDDHSTKPNEYLKKAVRRYKNELVETEMNPKL